MSGSRLPYEPPLAVGSIGTRASGWWGVWFLMASEGLLFAYLFFAYFYYSVQPQANWIPGGSPDFTYSAPQSIVILIGCVAAWWSERAIATRASRLLSLLGLGLTALCGAGFIALQFLDWFSKPFVISDGTYSSEYFVITGFHLAHVVVGEVMFIVLFVWCALNYFDGTRHLPITIGKIYWYFLAVIWFAVFLVLYVTPYLA